MENNKLQNVVLTVVAVLAGLALVLALKPATKEVVKETVVKEVVNSGLAERLVGAIPGPDLLNPWFSVNGVAVFPVSASLTTASTTLCRIRNPVGATSTLISASVTFTTASSAALQIGIARTTNSLSYATTTAIGTDFRIVGGVNPTVVASTSPTGSAIVFDPTDYLVINAIAPDQYRTLITSATGLAPVGRCKATFLAN